MISNGEYLMDNTAPQQVAIENSLNNMEPLVKEETINFFQDNFPNYVSNFEMIEPGSTVSIPEQLISVSFTDEEINQILASGNVQNNFNKIPIGYNDICNIDGIKTEPTTTSHYIRYKTDENGRNVKIWQCGICNKEFGHHYILMRHLPTHTDERKFVCKQCGKAFRQMSTLSQHRAIHSKLRPYGCEVCKKTFNRISTLISHRKTHTGNKPHQCHLCHKAFHQKGNLRNHIFTHTNARPYKCDICQKGFNQMSNLMCHKVKTHQKTDKPKYICSICNKEFDKRISLRNHEQYEHGEQNLSIAATATAPTEPCNDGVLVAPIKTDAMLHATKANKVPFALLRPYEGVPVLVKVLPAGDKQMLVPASAEDLRKSGEITIKKEEDDEAGVSNGASGSVTDEKKGTTVQIKIPVVASVIQRNRNGSLQMDVESPEPGTTVDQKYYITTLQQQNDSKTDDESSNSLPAFVDYNNTVTSDAEDVMFNYNSNGVEKPVEIIMNDPLFTPSPILTPQNPIPSRSVDNLKANEISKNEEIDDFIITLF